MAIRSFLFFVVGCGAAVAACSASVQDQCKQNISSKCQKIFDCNSPAIQVFGYSSESDCETKSLQAQNNCADATGGCPSGTTYDSSAADQCVADSNAESCADFNAGKVPPSCGQVCQ